jgi:hypothetical protein
LDRIDPKAEEASKGFLGGKETNIGLHERNEARKVENGVARKMMGLEFVKIEKFPEKSEAGRPKPRSK